MLKCLDAYGCSLDAYGCNMNTCGCSLNTCGCSPCWRLSCSATNLALLRLRGQGRLGHRLEDDCLLDGDGLLDGNARHGLRGNGCRGNGRRSNGRRGNGYRGKGYRGNGRRGNGRRGNRCRGCRERRGRRGRHGRHGRCGRRGGGERIQLRGGEAKGTLSRGGGRSALVRAWRRRVCEGAERMRRR